MSWFKVDDKFHDHPKARKAGKAAVGVWVLSGAWSADHLTDGFIPASVLSRWGSRADAKRLVDAGLWETAEHDGEAGWRFLKWDHYQPTRAGKKAERAAKAEAGRAGGRASGRSRRAATSPAEAKQAASGLVEPPSRPDPVVVQVPSQSRSAVRAIDGLTDGDLEQIRRRLGGSEDHAAQVAIQILSRADVEVLRPLRYVLAAVDTEPDRYRPTPGPPTKAQCCPRPGHGSYPVDNCGACRADLIAVDR